VTVPFLRVKLWCIWGRKDHSLSNTVFLCFCDDLVGGVLFTAFWSIQLYVNFNSAQDYATLATPYILRVIALTVKLSFSDKTTLPRTRVGAVSNSDGVMTMTSFSFVPTLRSATIVRRSYRTSNRATTGPRVTPLTLLGITRAPCLLARSRCDDAMSGSRQTKIGFADTVGYP
jgi:hypothetical protein